MAASSCARSTSKPLTSTSVQKTHKMQRNTYLVFDIGLAAAIGSARSINDVDSVGNVGEQGILPRVALGLLVLELDGPTGLFVPLLPGLVEGTRPVVVVLHAKVANDGQPLDGLEGPFHPLRLGTILGTVGAAIAICIRLEAGADVEVAVVGPMIFCQRKECLLIGIY